MALSYNLCHPPFQHLSVCGAPGKLGFFLAPTILDDLCPQLRTVENQSKMVQIRIVIRERWSVSDLWT